MQITALLLLVFAQLLQVHAQIEQNTVERYLQENRAAGNKPNSLIQQSSPYLLQHAYNPVHWYAWGEQAFELARKQNKPILLSIGYSTCYWCHVMAHESFENEKIASFLNKHFISIKLDREERPDIDDVYMAATELVNGYGGWPMTVFLNHDLEPFHAGVYYPPFSTDSSTGFYELLLKVSELWNKDRARIDLVAEQITSHIKAQADEVVAGASIDRDVLSEGFDQIADSYDEDYAGFGDAPKFPQPGAYAFLLSIAESKTENATSALQMLRQTLLAMSQGGLYDQVGGGFHRYSVDARWQVPHFEKMLYTQALMALAYTRLYEIEPDARYREVVTGTLQFVLDEMRHPQGAFYSALDASSERPDQPGEHAEGAYYLWRAADLRSALNKDEWEFIRRYFDIQDNGNIVSDPRGDFEKLNILYISEDYRQKKTVKKDSALLDSAKRRLGQQRLQRPRPHLDDKILVAWNGMMIRALVEAARVFKDQKYLDAAVAAAEFVQRHFIEAQNDVLYRRMRNDEVGIQANLVDYVWYVNGLLALYSQTGEKHWLQRAEKLTNKQVQLFHDAQSGGFYESATEKHVLFRSRSAYDGALPAPNAIAIENLYLLARL
ncbi:MAG: thioredoxin domain-containing protein, partial [Thiotrichales bacterium]